MTSPDQRGALWTLRVGAAASGVCFLLAVLELSWAPRPGPLPPGTEGGAFSVGSTFILAEVCAAGLPLVGVASVIGALRGLGSA